MPLNVKTECFQTCKISQIFLQETLGGCVPQKLIKKPRKIETQDLRNREHNIRDKESPEGC